MMAVAGLNTTQRRPRGLLTVLGVAAVAAVVAGLAWYARQPAERTAARHVIVISLDTTRADHFGCYGNTWIETPNLDALAAESILFTDYVTAISTTLSSHVSLFTGKYPHTHGVPRNGFIVHDDNVMLAEILKEAGFATVGFLGSFALHSRFNFAQGFDHFDQQFEIFLDGGKIDQNQRRAVAVTDAVIAYLDQHGVPPRLFLFVHYFDPHQPYDPPAPYDAMYGDAPGAIGFKDHPALAYGDGSEDSRRSLSRYAGEVSYMDHHVGRLLDELRRRGIIDQALLLVTSDHGENLGENPGKAFHHGRTVYQSEMHCVGLLRLPDGAQGGVRLDLPVASIDMLPTMVSYLGLPVPAGVEGDVLELGVPTRNELERPRFGEASKPMRQESDPRWFNNPKARCVRDGSFKYIRTQYLSKEGLYNLRTDPYEQNNLLESATAEVAARAADLRRKLDAWTVAQSPLPSRFDDRRRDETIARLKALGYLDADDEDEEDDSDAEEPP